jgi:hypothetical protein
MRSPAALQIGLTVFLFVACAGNEVTNPEAIPSQKPALQTSAPWGPETPPFNDEIILRGDGFGLVKFRQPNDADRIVYLDTWVRGLAPNTAYQLQRAVDTVVDDNCTSSAWLTLGKGTTPQTIVTDSRGTGREELFRNLGAFAPGSTFDIHFRVIDAVTSAVVLTSDCYQFTVSQ